MQHLQSVKVSRTNQIRAFRGKISNSIATLARLTDAVPWTEFCSRPTSASMRRSTPVPGIYARLPRRFLASISRCLAHVPAKHAPIGSLGLDPRVGSGSPTRTCANRRIYGARDSDPNRAVDRTAGNGFPSSLIIQQTNLPRSGVKARATTRV
jgi:hypothetical protein